MVTCVHHRVLETPNGPEVKGVCIKCGDVRTYLSAAPDTIEKAPNGKIKALAILAPRDVTWVEGKKGIL